MNINGTIKKLQSALLLLGLPVTISRSQFYSADQKRFVTIISLSTKISTCNKKGEWKQINHEIIRTASQIDALLCLVDIYKAVSRKE